VRERHVYIVGGTGNGKTTMLQGAAIQNIKAGKGVAVVDQHGDLAETLIKYIAENRINDVIYLIR
jgi:KaiC/GvpD/RAD55 family RecA-like ATPase